MAITSDRRLVLLVSGVALAAVLLAVRRFLVGEVGPAPAEPPSHDPAESLRRWRSRTETLIRWSESSRADWDRHLRPKLAREFQMATGHRQSKDPAALQATGRMLFGPELWAWVDPENVARTGGREPGPGSGGTRRNSAAIGADMTAIGAAATTTAYAEAVLDEIERVVVGKRAALTLILTTVLARGHVLIEDLPGLGKTLIARSFAAALGARTSPVCSSPQICCRPTCSARPSTTCSRAVSSSVAGPIFTNLLMADEINRTPPKTQAALLEAMAEGQVSIDGETHRLPAPFIVLATDNPIEYEGTYPLPEAQLDRFAIRLELKYLSEKDETFDAAPPARTRFGRTDGESGCGHTRLPGDARIGGAGDGARRRPALCGVAGDGHPPSPAGHRRCQPASGNRPGPARPCACPAARAGLCDTRGRQVACRSGAGAPDQPAAGDVGAAACTARMSWQNCCGVCRFRGRADRHS